MKTKFILSLLTVFAALGSSAASAHDYHRDKKEWSPRPGVVCDKRACYTNRGISYDFTRRYLGEKAAYKLRFAHKGPDKGPRHYRGDRHYH